MLHIVAWLKNDVWPLTTKQGILHLLIDLLLAFRDKRLMQNMIQNVIIESTMDFEYLHINICIHVYSRNIY